jgi:hypothetical protein
VGWIEARRSPRALDTPDDFPRHASKCLRGRKLKAEKPLVHGTAVQQFAVGAHVQNGSLIHHHDLIRLQNGGEAMSDGHNGAATAEHAQRVTNIPGFAYSFYGFRLARGRLQSGEAGSR